MTNSCDWLIENVKLVTFTETGAPYGVIEGATVATTDGKISHVVTSYDEPINAEQRIDGRGRCLTPGLIDCHTHLVFGGNRALEFEWRLRGESYESIAKRGGGIISTVTETRKLSKDELINQSAPRLQRLMAEGVTTIEIKSGYGLDLENEIKMLEVARLLGELYPVTIKTTFLGAHALPPEFRDLTNPKQKYIDHVCNDMMPAIHELGLADAVDVFCEGIGFSVAQCEQVFSKASELGLAVKGHVEQLSNLQGAVMAAKHNALSVDHIEYLATNDVAALGNSVAVLLPAAFYFLNETQRPPVQALREHQIPIAVATDLNPGTAPMASLLTAMNQACVLFGLTPEEALKGITVNAARALGIESKGRLEIGMDADMALWNIDHPAELAYGLNFHRPDAVWHNGQWRA